MSRPAHIRPRAVALAAALLTMAGIMLAGCFTSLRCEDDNDCGNSQCTRTGECSIEAVYVVLTWTINGGTADEAACRDVGQFAVVFEDNQNGLTTAYEPVPCTLGRIYFDRMPSRFDRVVVRADNRNGIAITQESVAITAPGIEAAVDLRLPSAQ